MADLGELAIELKAELQGFFEDLRIAEEEAKKLVLN